MRPLIRAVASSPALASRIVLTGQHPDLSDFFPGALLDEIAEDVRDHSVAELREVLTDALTKHMLDIRPVLVIVQGDTTSALAGALAARACGIPVAHVEAGLRSHDIEPWPEEQNRVAIDAIAALLFAPTDAAVANLAAEPAVTGAVHVTGNSGIDALLEAHATLAEAVTATGRRTILVTCHRRENRGDALIRICAALKRLVREFPVDIAFILHPNIHVRSGAVAQLADCPNIDLMEPVDYASMVSLIRNCWIILTDSGGLQEEGPALGKPVLVLRAVTERVEARDRIQLVGTDPEAIIGAVRRLWLDELHYKRMATPILPFGDGRSGPRIARIIERWLLGEPGDCQGPLAHAGRS